MCIYVLERGVVDGRSRLTIPTWNRRHILSVVDGGVLAVGGRGRCEESGERVDERGGRWILRECQVAGQLQRTERVEHAWAQQVVIEDVGAEHSIGSSKSRALKRGELEIHGSI